MVGIPNVSEVLRVGMQYLAKGNRPLPVNEDCVVGVARAWWSGNKVGVELGQWTAAPCLAITRGWD